MHVGVGPTHIGRFRTSLCPDLGVRVPVVRPARCNLQPHKTTPFCCNNLGMHWTKTSPSLSLLPGKPNPSPPAHSHNLPWNFCDSLHHWPMRLSSLSHNWHAWVIQHQPINSSRSKDSVESKENLNRKLVHKPTQVVEYLIELDQKLNAHELVSATDPTIDQFQLYNWLRWIAKLYRT